MCQSFFDDLIRIVRQTNGLFFHVILDAIYASVFATRKAQIAEMVCRTPGQGEKEDHPRAHHDNSRPQAQNVLVSRVEGL